MIRVDSGVENCDADAGAIERRAVGGHHARLISAASKRDVAHRPSFANHRDIANVRARGFVDRIIASHRDYAGWKVLESLFDFSALGSDLCVQ